MRRRNRKVLDASPEPVPAEGLDTHPRPMAFPEFPAVAEPARLVFIDETGVDTKLGRRYGRAPVGDRCIGRVPHGHWRTLTFVAALRCVQLAAPWVLDGPMFGMAFLTYCTQVLVPVLRPGDRVICDNFSCHKVAGVHAAIAAAGAQLIYLPPYSPDLNPIEMAFAKLKAYLRMRAAPDPFPCTPAHPEGIE
jgi:transposase